MPRLLWEPQGKYEAGVSQGVFYPPNEEGVPWNGLTSVVEGSVGGEHTSHYLDGIKFLDFFAGREYQATITAFAAPRKLLQFIGERPYIAGFVIANQMKRRFNLSYRTETESGYKLHLVYNALATSQGRSFESEGAQVSPSMLTLTIDATPVKVPGFRPTAHFVVNSETTPPAILSELEDLLYGTENTQAEFPTIAELMTIFGGP